jgi:hypothetical protein
MHSRTQQPNPAAAAIAVMCRLPKRGSANMTMLATRYAVIGGMQLN